MTAELVPAPAPPPRVEAGRVGALDGRCEAWPHPFARCRRAALWVIVLDVAGDDGQLRERWSEVSTCKDHRQEAHLLLVTQMAGNRAAIVHITPTERNGDVRL